MPLTEEQRKRKIASMLKSWQKYGLTKCKKITATTFQLMIRVEASDGYGIVQCCSCGKRGYYQGFDAGHWISRSKTGTLFQERNVHPQCKWCNNPANSGDAGAGYSRYMLETYGQSVMDELQERSRVIISYTKEDLATMRRGYWERIEAKGVKPR